MKTVSRRVICVFVAVVMLLASLPAQAPLNALKKTDATDLSVLSNISSLSVIPSPGRARVSTALSNSPILFIENVGQFAPSASPTGTGQAGALGGLIFLVGLIFAIVSFLLTVLYFLVTYSMGEVIYLFLAMEENTRATSTWIGRWLQVPGVSPQG